MHRLGPEQSKLAEKHVYLVRAIARRVWQRLAGRMDLGELEGHGTDGLVRAAIRYDARRGASFATFAGYRIRGAMVDAVRVACVELTGRSLSVAGEGGEPDAEQQAMHRQSLERLRRALAALPADERRFVHRVYFDGLPLADAGAELGISRSWASRLHARTVTRLRAALEASQEYA